MRQNAAVITMPARRHENVLFVNITCQICFPSWVVDDIIAQEPHGKNLRALQRAHFGPAGARRCLTKIHSELISP
jgi:hypothetical protein